MLGKLNHEMEVNVAASEAWELCRGLQLPNIAQQSLPNLFSKVVVIEGDGGVGTIIEIFFPPGTPGMTSYKEKYVVCDDIKRVKTAEVVEGGYLNVGFTSYRVQLEIIEKEDVKDWCIMKATADYEIPKEVEANASFASMEPVAALMQAAADYLVSHKQED